MLKNIRRKFNNILCKVLNLKSFSAKKKAVEFNKLLSGNFLGKKYHMVNGASLSISTKENEKTKKIEENIDLIAKKYLSNPKDLFKYIETKGTKVYILKFANKILSYIGESEGFILPQKGIKAFYLNLILNKEIKFNTDEMFVLRNYNTVECVLLYQFYNWYCFKNKVTGYETESQNKFKKVFKICSSKEEMDNLTFEDLMMLKNSVRRDIEAIEFVQKYINNSTKAKEKLNGIKSGKLVKI